MFRFLASTALALAFALPAQAQDTLATDFATQGAGGPEIGFTLGLGVQTAPTYFGSGENEFGPDVSFQLNYLRLGGLSFGDPDPLYVPEGFGVSGSFRYIDERTADDDPELAGLEDVDRSLELGVGLRYATRDYRVFGNVRYGVIGHESFVGEIGADIFARPNDRLTLRAGPRVLFGDDDYADTYFGVTAAEAANSNFTAYDPSGGAISAGIELGAGYRLNEDWGIDASVRYDVLTGDAEDSPIVRDNEEITATLGLTRRFTFGF